MKNLSQEEQNAFRLISQACADITQPLQMEGVHPLSIDWGYLLYFADLNGLSGLLHQAIQAMPKEQRSLVPFRVSVTLRNQSQRYKARWDCYDDILKQITKCRPSDMTIVLLKGASFKSYLYSENPDARGMGDIDLLVSSDNSQEVINWVEEWGFSTRQSKNGITAIRNADGQRSVIDIHIDDPAKTGRNPTQTIKILLKNLVDAEPYPGLKMPTPEFSLVHACKHFCEHQRDFRKILFQDDIKLIRLLDISLLSRICSVEKAGQLAKELGWDEEWEIGLKYASVIGSNELDAELSKPESLETPLGKLTWPVGFSDLVSRLDRAEWLSAQLGDNGGRDLWYSTEKGILNPVQG